MGSRIAVVAFLFVVFVIACWLTLRPIFQTFAGLQPNLSYQVAVTVIIVAPISLIVFFGLALYMRRE